MKLLLHFLLSYISGIGFCLLFTVRKRNIPLAALGAATSWMLFQLFLDMGTNAVFATFLSGIILGFMTEAFAVYMKSPATNFIIIGIIPLVPGLKVYQGILSLINDELMKGISTILEACFIAVAIGVAMLVSSSIARIFRIRRTNALRQKRQKRK
ncbi:MAG: threonine/serine exporter family protein [Tissierellia bacterium]|nr:threonine/serine exporter family protein [Tissierellia bacterium]